MDRKQLETLFPGLVVFLGLLYFAWCAIPSSLAEGDWNLAEFAALPVIDGGRIKPIETVARTNMLLISNRQGYRDLDDKYQPAVKWLLEVQTSKYLHNTMAEQLKVFRIENLEVLNLLKLEPRALRWRFAIDEFRNHIDDLDKEAKRALAIDPKQRDLFDVKVLELAQHLDLYIKMATLKLPLSCPPDQTDGEWVSLPEGVEQRRTSALHLAAMLVAYADHDKKKFNQEVADYHKWLNEKYPQDMSKVRFEVFFNHFEPFYQCKMVYIAAGLLALLSWLVWSRPLRNAAFWLAVATAAVHFFALWGRMYLQDRPLVFVTNLYSSAIFIAWGCVVIGLVLERIFPLGVGVLKASVLGACLLHLAPSLGSGDTLEMMQAVLDTNFWLATHVTTITLGYVAMFVAGHLGWTFIILGLATPSLRDELYQALSKMIYGVLCFATLLSFVGTVLGGIWADQSWGRFWGWDPKENGALLIVLWSALILHARWGGLIKQRGVAVLAVAGNIVTAWSWFGVNMLGVGLHSYGFNSGLFWVLTVYVPLNLVIIGAGLLPLKMWRSFQPHTYAPLSKPVLAARVVK